MAFGGNWRNWLGKTITIISSIVAIPSLVLAYLAWKHPTVTEPKKVEYKLQRYNFPKVAVYYGEVCNADEVHAKDLAIKGEFSSKVLSLDIESPDPYTKHLSGTTMDFQLMRLSKGNRCKFEIFVDKSCEIRNDLTATWGESGKLTMKLQPSNSDIEQGIALGKKVSEKDISRKARAKWVENNSKNIGEVK